MEGVEALVFDIMGTTVDWHGSVTQELKHLSDEYGIGEHSDWDAFAKEWRHGYWAATRSIAAGGTGSTNVDTVHREVLDNMLKSPRWSHVDSLWDEAQRTRLNLVWHRLKAWSDVKEGLQVLKEQYIIAALSNGNIRMLVDMAKHADLPWDVVFSAELFGSYKPNPKVYLGVIKHLSIPPTKCAMVAAHLFDLRGAASQGMKTVYVRRLTEDDEDNEVRDQVKSKADGGEVDMVVDSFMELAAVLGGK